MYVSIKQIYRLQDFIGKYVEMLELHCCVKCIWFPILTASYFRRDAEHVNNNRFVLRNNREFEISDLRILILITYQNIHFRPLSTEIQYVYV